MLADGGVGIGDLAVLRDLGGLTIAATLQYRR